MSLGLASCAALWGFDDLGGASAGAGDAAAAASDAVGALNIGTGVETSVLDIVEVLRALGDEPFDAEHAEARPGEVRHNALDPSRAREKLGWQGKVSVREGLERTLTSLR